jgi:hypothetical protein
MQWARRRHAQPATQLEYAPMRELLRRLRSALLERCCDDIALGLVDYVAAGAGDAERDLVRPAGGQALN